MKLNDTGAFLALLKQRDDNEALRAQFLAIKPAPVRARQPRGGFFRRLFSF